MKMEKKGVTVWFTGLPCCGKTTIAKKIKEKLDSEMDVVLLDGDTVRDYIKNKDFSQEGRNKHLRYIALMAKLLSERGVIVLCTFVSPYRENRDFARSITEDFVEIYVKCPVEVCIERDVKGMYKKALNGEIKNFTGVDDPYEEPENPELVLETDRETVEESVEKVLKKLEELGYINMPVAEYTE
ncbi:MAG: adenylyl-sulfate kinase [Thermoplasmata archaeon]|nr:MAG: adenylyl-sulfate kinase [Thermoplasmata archaeon]RLF65073.1 MAG: adenylyl-sulfate kinase [Thermoplasmata archaeon]